MVIGLDTETTGLKWNQGDRIFAVVMSAAGKAYYFGFQDYPDEGVEGLPLEAWGELRSLASQTDKRWWVLHNAKFDMHMLAREDIYLVGNIHDTIVAERMLDNHAYPNAFALENMAKQYGVKKLDAELATYLNKNKLVSKKKVPGTASTFETLKSYDKVAHWLMSEYAMNDAWITEYIAKKQRKKLRDLDRKIAHKHTSTYQCYLKECELLRTVFHVEHEGVPVDTDYCHRAIKFCEDGIKKFEQDFLLTTGRKYVQNSGPLMAAVFGDREFVYTDKGRPSFDKEVLEGWATDGDGLAAKILAARSLKADANVYHSIMHRLGDNGRLNGNFAQHGARTGRFTSSGPNLQNLKKDEDDDLDREFVVRRAFVPDEGHFLAMLDYDQMEYRMALDYAGAKGIAAKIADGLDVHGATASLAAVERRPAKTVNFSILYGSGDGTLSVQLRTGIERARAIKEAVFAGVPELRVFIDRVKFAARSRGWLRTWDGRHLRYSRDEVYKSVNGLIQGGTAGVVKQAMIDCAKWLMENKYKTKLVMTIHDELVFHGPKDELHILPELKRIMESVFDHKLIPLTVGIDVSFKSLADKVPYSEVA